MVQTQPGRPEARRSEARRAEILRRAAEVFRRRGFHGAGMREIARGLGMAPGALYYYFPSKEDLLYACQTISLKRLLDSARTIAALGIAPAEKLRRLVDTHLVHVLDELGGSLAHVEFHALPPARLRRVVRRRDLYESVWREVIEEGVRAGAFRPVDAKTAVLALLGSLNWTVVWWRPGGRRSRGEVAESFADLFLQGIQT